MGLQALKKEREEKGIQANWTRGVSRKIPSLGLFMIVGAVSGKGGFFFPGKD